MVAVSGVLLGETGKLVMVEVGAVGLSSKGLMVTTRTVVIGGKLAAAVAGSVRLEPPEEPAGSMAGGSRREGELDLGSAGGPADVGAAGVGVNSRSGDAGS